MNNKKLKVLIMLIISILSIGILKNSYAVSVCTIKGEFSPNNPIPGQEVTIDISATEINDAIAGLGFSLEYDAEKFDIVSATATDLWEISQTETLFTILTKNFEATKNTGKIATIKLKVKENVSTSETTIKLTNVEVTTDDGGSVNIGDISETINITTKEGQQENKPSENDAKPTEKPTISTEVDNNKIVDVNGKTNSGASTKDESTNKDASTTNKLLPKTGVNMVYTIAITVVLIGMGASFAAYRKYKNIK